MSPEEITVGIDIGGSGTRLAVRQGEAVTRADLGDLTAALVAHDPAAALERLAREVRASAGAARIRAVAIGAAGLTTHAGDLRELEARAAHDIGADRAIVTSDIVAAHVGALGGRPGAVLAAGTGAIALGADLAGAWRRVDGWGHLLGDLGSGAWIGMEALRVAAAHLDGRREDGESLAEIASARFGPILRWPGAIYPVVDRARILASLVPDVATAATHDTSAARILDDAASHLSRTLVAALTPGIAERVAVVGGLASVPRLVDPLLERVRVARPGVEVETAQGTPLDGTLLIADLLRADADPLPGHSAIV